MIDIDLGEVQETLLMALWARAREAEKDDPIVRDELARDIVAKLDYDFSRFEGGETENHQFVWPIRAWNFDAEIREFLAREESSAVVNIGAGLDTTFQRIDDGAVVWINIDLPDAAALRQKLIPDSGRVTTIARSVLDFSWIDDITGQTQDRSILFMAAGVLFYFEPPEVQTLFRKLAESYPGADLVFDAMTRFTAWGVNRKIMKDSGMGPSARIRWHLNRGSQLRKFIDTIKLVDEYSLLSRVPVKPDWSRKLVFEIKVANLLRLYNMFHVQF